MFNIKFLCLNLQYGNQVEGSADGYGITPLFHLTRR